MARRKGTRPIEVMFECGDMATIYETCVENLKKYRCAVHDAPVVTYYPDDLL